MTEGFTQGAAIAAALTILVRLYLNTQSKSSGMLLPFSSRDFSAFFIELFMIGGFIGALTLCAVLGSAAAWQIFLGYSVVRAARIGYLLIKSH